MADGQVQIDVRIDGKQITIAEAQLKKFKQEAEKPIGNDGIKPLDDSMKKFGDSTNNTTPKVKNFFLAFGAVEVAKRAFSILQGSLDSAIKRFDTLQSYPRIMKLLGFSTEDVAKSTKQLSDGIDGLPTRLDEVVATSKQLTTITKDIGYSTKLTLALNNAFLASGSSAEDASRGLVQFQQMLSSGKVDMQSWKTLQETMPIALAKTAEAFGFTGASAKTQFYGALQRGEITFDQFGKKLIELNNGVGGFAELAKESSRGIGTSMKNLANSSIKGLASMIEAFDAFTKALTGKNIDQHIDSLKNIINGGFNAINSVIKAGIPIAQAIGQGFYFIGEKLAFLKPLLEGVVATFILLLGIKGVTLAIAGFSTAVTFATGVVTAFAGAINALVGPVGWIGTGMIALGFALVKFAESMKSEKVKEYEAKISGLKEEAKATTEAIADTKSKVSDLNKEMENGSKSVEKLAEETFALASKSNRSSAETVLLKKNISSLNQQVDGLNLKYDKNSKMLSMNIDQVKQRIQAGQGNERLVEVEKQLSEAYQQTIKVNQELLDAESKYKAIQEDTSISTWKKKGLLKDLQTTIEELKTAQQDAVDNETALKEIQMQNAQQVADAVEAGANRQILTYASLDEAQQKAVDGLREKYTMLQESATNAFERIKQDAVVSVQDMQANMVANTQTVAEFGTNIKALTERGLNQGLIDQLKEAGPKSAEQVKALVNASDTELQGLNEAFTKGGDAAKEALRNMYNLPPEETTEKLMNLVTQSKETLTTAIQNAGFAEAGKQIPAGVVEGMNSGSEDVVAPAQAMASKIPEAFGAELGIHSPSRVMAEQGTYVVQGVVQGITESQSELDSAMQTMGTSMVNKFEETKSQLESKANQLPNIFRNMYGSLTSSGQYAMDGLAQGMSNRMSYVMSVARSIADSVKSTIRSALDIHSPSRVMRDEVGKFIPLGIAVGMDRNADAVEKSAYQLRDKLMNVDFSADSLLNRGKRMFNNGLDIFAGKQAYEMNLAYSGGEIVVPVTISEREVARVVAPIVRGENQRIEKIEKLKRGDR